LIKQDELQNVVRAINRQIKEDFYNYWSLGATLRLEGKSLEQPGLPLDNQSFLPVDMRGDAVIYLQEEVDVNGALGYHDKNFQGIPFGVVFPILSKQIGENWTTTLSHEALELILDPEVNLLVKGPHPDNSGREVFHWYEACDAVQSETYTIDGVEVSNFVLPLYFTSGEESQGHNDFLGTINDGATLRSFGVNPGGYVGFYNPQTGNHDQFTLHGDTKAAKTLEIKAKMGEVRRGSKYQNITKLTKMTK